MHNLQNFLKSFSALSRHHKKFANFIFPELLKINKGNILEFGVSEKAMSTELFLEYSKNSECRIFSIDTVDYSKKFQNSSWTFIHSRDDNFNYIKKMIPTELDLILLDTVHEANHVENIIFNYWERLKLNCCFFIDDINWMPYLKSSKKNRFYDEINNHETFHKLLEIYYSNEDQIELDFTFNGTGMCKIKKINNKKLNLSKKIETRVLSIKNLFRRLIKR